MRLSFSNAALRDPIKTHTLEGDSTDPPGHTTDPPETLALPKKSLRKQAFTSLMHIWILCKSPWGRLLVGEGMVGSFSAVSRVTWGPNVNWSERSQCFKTHTGSSNTAFTLENPPRVQSHRNCTAGGREIKPKQFGC